MAFIVYILYTKLSDQYYIGHTSNLDDRLFRHINSGSKFTKKAKDWELAYKEEFITKSDAYKREMEIKNKKSRKFIKMLISAGG